MLQKDIERTIFVPPVLNEAGFQQFTKDLKELLKKPDPITVWVTCEGGWCSIGFSFFDLLFFSGVEVTTIGSGCIGSMGVVVFLAGKKRLLTDTSHIFLHEMHHTFEESDAKNLSHSALRNYARSVETNMEKYIRLLSQRTKMDSKTIAERMKEESYFYPQTALDLGFATGILLGNGNVVLK